MCHYSLSKDYDGWNLLHCMRDLEEKLGSLFVLERRFYWFGLKKDIYDFVKKCLTCQKVKYDRAKTSCLLLFLPSRGNLSLWISESRFPKSLHRNNQIWVLVDRLLGCKDGYLLLLVWVGISLCLARFYCPMFEYTMIGWHGAFLCSNPLSYCRVCHPVTSGRHFM